MLDILARRILCQQYSSLCDCSVPHAMLQTCGKDFSKFEVCPITIKLYLSHSILVPGSPSPLLQGLGCLGTRHARIIASHINKLHAMSRAQDKSYYCTSHPLGARMSLRQDQCIGIFILYVATPNTLSRYTCTVANGEDPVIAVHLWGKPCWFWRYV